MQFQSSFIISPNFDITSPGTDALLDELLNSIDTPTISTIASAPRAKQALPPKPAPGKPAPGKAVQRPKPPPTR